MSRRWTAGVLLAVLAAAPAAAKSFAKGQLFISAYAGFVPANAGWDVMYNLCFESAISRSLSVGFAYSQKQSHAGERHDRLVVPPPGAVAGELLYADITTRLFCLEGKAHVAGGRNLDLFCGSGLGLELNKNSSLLFRAPPAGEPGAALEIVASETNHYYLVANFFAGASWYLADNLALSAKAGYQYSGISGTDAVLSAGITFRIR